MWADTEVRTWWTAVARPVHTEREPDREPPAEPGLQTEIDAGSDGSFEPDLFSKGKSSGIVPETRSAVVDIVLCRL